MEYIFETASDSSLLQQYTTEIQSPHGNYIHIVSSPLLT